MGRGEWSKLMNLLDKKNNTIKSTTPFIRFSVMKIILFNGFKFLESKAVPLLMCFV